MAAHQAPPSLGFSRQEHWSGLPHSPFPTEYCLLQKDKLAVLGLWRNCMSISNTVFSWNLNHWTTREVPFFFFLFGSIQQNAKVPQPGVKPWPLWWKPAAAAAKSLQSCPTLCNSIDGNPRGSPVPWIPQARTLDWVAISFSNA